MKKTKMNSDNKNISFKTIIFLCFTILLGIPTDAQIFNNKIKTIFKKTEKYAGSGFRVASNKSNPFWIRSNEYGTVPFQSNNLFVSAGLKKEYDSTFNIQKKLLPLDIGYGFQLFSNIGTANTFSINEGYLKIRFKFLEVYGGRRREIIGLTDSTLSSGSIIWSGNAIPIPKIQISTPNYVPIFKSKMFFFKAALAHGWFGNQYYVQKYYLHQKALYGKFGKSEWKINLLAGVNNQMQWGGYSDYIKNSPGASANGYLPSGFNAFISGAFPFPYIRKKFPPNISLLYDNLNYGGNHLGSLDIAAQIKLKKSTLFLYKQMPYELGSLFTGLVNADDGIYGISIKLKKPVYSLTAITLEGLHTFNEGYYRSGISRLLGLPDNHFGEPHRYFNHGQYNDGWSYNQNGIGTPFIFNNVQIDPLNKTYDNKFNFSNYNQVKLLYVALEGRKDKLGYKVKSNFGYYRQTLGAYIPNNPLFKQFSFYSDINRNVKRLNFKFSIAIDKGEMLQNNIGCTFMISKKWH